MRKKYMDDSKDYCKYVGKDAISSWATRLHENSMLKQLHKVLHLLCIVSTHQRQGLGTLLINEGLAIADKHHAKTFIEATPKGLGLYLKHGWKPVDEIVIDLKNYGGSMVAREVCLMRQPGGG